MKKAIAILSSFSALLYALPVMAADNGATSIYNGYTNVATGFTVILVWIILILLIGVLWKNLQR